MNKLFASPAACRDIVLAVVLAAGMWLTRSHDVTILTLPDLTWAAFFLAGALSHRWVLPIGLTLNAFAIDYVALSHGVSDYCVTPAYAFLIPTHFCLWAAGRWTRSVHLGSSAHVACCAIALCAGVIGAFCISNVGFFAFAGYFDDVSAAEYARRVLRYFPAFFESTALYGCVGLLVAYAVQRVAAFRSQATSK
ncbi:MAG: hypothetical protein C0P74_004250 [Gammaproteobacteria bacterium]|nr:hypothetical protein [Gammaproteobacteria bacterium]